jgi:hypothetical protein
MFYSFLGKYILGNLTVLQILITRPAVYKFVYLNEFKN